MKRVSRWLLPLALLCLGFPELYAGPPIDRAGIDSRLDQAFALEIRAPQRGIELAQRGLAQARELAYRPGAADALYIPGILAWNPGRCPQALNRHLQALDIREELRTRRGWGLLTKTSACCCRAKARCG